MMARYQKWLEVNQFIYIYSTCTNDQISPTSSITQNELIPVDWLSLKAYLSEFHVILNRLATPLNGRPPFQSHNDGGTGS